MTAPLEAAWELGKFFADKGISYVQERFEIAWQHYIEGI